jgi:VanZ family protein
VFQKLIAAAAWACLVFIAFATLSSIDLRPELIREGTFKAFFTVVERFGAYAVLGLLFGLAYPRRPTFVCVLVFGSAVSLELLQSYVPSRHAGILDVVEKSLGGAAGIILADITKSNFSPHRRT